MESHTLDARMGQRIMILLGPKKVSDAGVGFGMLRGIPLLENKKFVGFTKCPFHVFDRSEIHIQDFVDFILPTIMMSRSSSSHFMKVSGKKNEKN